MTDRITIDIADGDTLAAIDRALAGLADPTALMRQIGATLETNIAQRFITKRDPSGTPWLPLAPSTLERKKGVGSILEHFNHGKGSLDYNAGADFVEIGFGERYMAWHELGTQRMPRRGLLTDDPIAGTLGADDTQDILDCIDGYLAGLL